MKKLNPKVGVFIWDQGGWLARAIDLDALVKKFTKAKVVVRCEVLNDLWSTALLDLIKKDLEAGQVDRVMWVGRFTSYQIKCIKGELASTGLNPYLHEWCDLEEQGICVEGIEPGVQTCKAMTLIQMALARTRLLEPLEPMELPGSNAVLIIGAGVAGLHAALSFVELGKRVYLVEKQSGVGGKVALLSRFYPRLCDPRCGLEFVLHKLSESDLVGFYTLSNLISLDGSPGNFQARVQKQPRYVNEVRCNTCGACVDACPVELSWSSGVIQNLTHKTKILKGVNGFLQSTRKAIHPSIPMAFPSAFLIEKEHCPPECRECEKVCPTQAVELNQSPLEEILRVGAVLITTGWDPYPLSKVVEKDFGYGLYPNVISNFEMEQLLGSETQGQSPPSGFSLSDLKEVGFIQCVGSRDLKHLKYCSSVCCSATLKQVLYLKEQVPDVNCYIFYQDIRSPGFDEDLYLRVRLLDGVVFFRDLPTTVGPEGDTGKLNIIANDIVLGRNVEVSLDLLVLAGGMIPSEGSQEVARVLNLPQNQYGFFESHLQCHPEESQRTGIYVGGCAREPMNVAQSIESSHRAAMKALKYLEGTVQVEPTYPVLDKTKCDQCKRCMEECPFSSFVFDEKGFPSLDLAKCRQCGNCMGVCPLVAISLRHNTIKQMAAQVAAINSSFIGSNEPVILAFLCENGAYKAAQFAVELGLSIPPNVIFIKVPCAGAVNNALIADAVSSGIDGVLIAGCKDGQCQYVWGNQLVRKRSSDLSDKLKMMMIEPERIRFEDLEIRDAGKYVDILTSYIEDLRAMGPNPFKFIKQFLF